LEKSWVVWKAECDDQKERVGELVIDSCSYKGKDRGSRTALSRTGGAKPLRAWHLRTECVGGEKSVHGKSPNTLAYRDCGKDLVEARKADVPDARPSWCLVVPGCCSSRATSAAEPPIHPNHLTKIEAVKSRTIAVIAKFCDFVVIRCLRTICTI
jgi:hypothetical protein